MLEVGKKAPAFSTIDQHGEKVRLSSLAGRYVVLYFYPRDNTPGCTDEACAFRDEHGALEMRGAAVLGVSPDSAQSHLRFTEKFRLPFQLLADEEHLLAEKYGAWGEKNLYGRRSMGIIRSTVLIGPDGKVVQVWTKVRVRGHAEQVLAALDAHREQA
jgi:peroxiredoxin Q/BCP